MRFECAILELDLRSRFWYRVAPTPDVSCLEAAKLYVTFALWESDPAHCSSKEQAVSPGIDVRRKTRASDVGSVSSYPVVSVTAGHVYAVQPADDIAVVFEGLRKGEVSRVLLLCSFLACAIICG